MAANFPVRINIRSTTNLVVLKQTTAELRRMTAAIVAADRASRKTTNQLRRMSAAGVTAGRSVGGGVGAGQVRNPAGRAFGGPRTRNPRGSGFPGGVPVPGGGLAVPGGGGSKTQRRINQAAVLGGLSSSLGRISRQSANAFAAPIRAAAEFEKVMVSTGAKTGATADKIEELTQQARKLGADARFQFSATEVGGAQGFLAQAGFDVDQIQASIRSTLDLGAASGEDLGFASDFLSDVTKSFRVIDKDTSLEEVQAQMRRFADVSVKTTNTSNANLRQLAGSLLTVGPVASAAGAGLEQVAGAVGVLANAGIKGTKAGTDLRNVFLRLSAPTKNARKALASIGLSKEDLQDAKGNLQGLTSIFNILDQALEKTFGPGNKTKKSAVFDALLGKRTTASGFVLADAARSGDLAAQINRGRGAGGAAAEVAKLKAGTTAGKLKAARAQLESLQIEIGNQFVPVMLEAVKVLGPFVKGLGEFVKANPALTRTIGSVLLATTALSGALAAAATVATVTLATRAAVSALSGASISTGAAAASATQKVGALGTAFGSTMKVMAAALAGFTAGKALDRFLDISGFLSGEEKTEGTVRGFATKSVATQKDIALARDLEKESQGLREGLGSNKAGSLVGAVAVITPDLIFKKVLGKVESALDESRRAEEKKLINIDNQLSQAKGRIKAAQQREGESGRIQSGLALKRQAETESLELLIKVEDDRVKVRKGKRTTKKTNMQVETGPQIDGV